VLLTAKEFCGRFRHSLQELRLQTEHGQAGFPPKWTRVAISTAPEISCVDPRKPCFDIWHLNVPQERHPEMVRSILIVDDNAFIRKALCERFAREEDFDICGEAENGRDAIEKAQQLRPDLIVLDMSMPVMNGLDAARVLKRLMPRVLLMMYSAFGDRYMEQQAFLLGISSVISKSEPATTVVGTARSLLAQTAA